MKNKKTELLHMIDLFDRMRDSPLRLKMREAIPHLVKDNKHNEWLMRLMWDRLSHFELEMYNLAMNLEETDD